MMKVTVFMLFLGLLLAKKEMPRVFQQPKKETTSETYVIELTDKTIHQFLADNDLVLVAFYSPKCIKCEYLLPHLDESSVELKNTGLLVKIAKVDIKQNIRSASTYHIKSYPTIIIFHKGAQHEIYKGPRSTEHLIQYLKELPGKLNQEGKDL